MTAEWWLRERAMSFGRASAAVDRRYGELVFARAETVGRGRCPRVSVVSRQLQIERNPGGVSDPALQKKCPRPDANPSQTRWRVR